MLIRFSVSNFLSILEEQEISLYPSKVKKFPAHVFKTNSNNIPNILKTALIYGANSSGKSNLVKAMHFSQELIISDRNTNWTVPFFSIIKDPLKISKFTYDLFINNNCYQYGFIIKDRVISEEWLIIITKYSEKILFTRKTIEEKVDILFNLNFKNEESKIFHQTIFKGTRANQLFLNFINEKNKSEIEEIFKLVFDWFKNKLTIIFPLSKISGMRINLLEDKSLLEFYNKTICLFDTGIDHLKFVEYNIDDSRLRIPNRIKNDIKSDINDKNSIVLFNDQENNIYYCSKEKDHLVVRTIEAFHNIPDSNKSINFSFNVESDGTNRIIDLIPMLYLIGESNTIVIDEINRSLHSLISEKFFEIFYKKSTNIGSQLIATTHDLNLLDLKKFRRDEIWFIMKNKDNQSKLFSLEEFKTRFDKNLLESYLEGRFGAIPLLNNCE